MLGADGNCLQLLSLLSSIPLLGWARGSWIDESLIDSKSDRE